MAIPGVSALFFKPANNIAESGEIPELLAAGVAVENDDGHAPEALAGNAPVGPARDHVVHALLAPGGTPLDPANFLERLLAKRFGCSTSRALSGACDLIHLDEPLLGGAEDHRIVAAPAVRVAVRIVRGGKKRAALAEKLDDDRIGSEDVLALVFGQAFGIDAAVRSEERRVGKECRSRWSPYH